MSLPIKIPSIYRKESHFEFASICKTCEEINGTMLFCETAYLYRCSQSHCYQNRTPTLRCRLQSFPPISCQSSQPANHLRAASKRHPGEAGRRCGLLWSDSYRTNSSDAIAHESYRNMSVYPGVGPPMITTSTCQCWIISFF
jgi:hypothetical protein